MCIHGWCSVESVDCGVIVFVKEEVSHLRWWFIGVDIIG